MDVESNDYWALPQENRLKMEDELEQARIAMETDYVPDPYQYHCSDVPVPMAGWVCLSCCVVLDTRRS